MDSDGWDNRDEFDDLPAGSRVGPYVIVDRLGRGGMGQVFLGTDPRLNRKVALKCLIASPSIGDDRRPHILHEARAAARINHPNVATVHDVIEHDARVFIVMEYVEGESLAARLKRGRLPIDRIVAIGRQLAAGLAAAHATGIVHRDLKPANIHVTPDGSVKVLDFGVAKAIANVATTADGTRRPSAEARAAPPGTAGTPGYMSPEQMLGRDVEERSDIFTLGVILYEMTTGRRPFAGTDPNELVIAVTKRPPRADAGDPRVPRGLADVIAKALEADVEARYQSAAEVGLALEIVDRELEPTTTRVFPPAIAAAKTRPILRVVTAIVLAPVALAAAGFLTTAAFNTSFGRTGAFGWESPWAYAGWGIRSIVAPLFFITATTAIVVAIAFMLRVLRLFAAIDRALKRVRARSKEMGSRLGLDDPNVLAQGLATLGVAAVLVVWWRYSHLILAWSSFISTAPASALAPLRPDNFTEKGAYRLVLDVLVFAFGAGLYRILQLRARQRARGGIGALTVLAAVITMMALMTLLPYRMLIYGEGERVDLGGNRCYIIGAHGDDLLVHCPDAATPRNRVVKGSDPSMRRLGVVESVFTPASRP